MVNHSMMAHPMHLDGHAFQVIAVNGEPFVGAVRDTVLVPPMGNRGIPCARSFHTTNVGFHEGDEIGSAGHYRVFEFESGMVSGWSSASTMKTARRLAGWVPLAFSLTR
jgi:hypothetical protein